MYANLLKVSNKMATPKYGGWCSATSERQQRPITTEKTAKRRQTINELIPTMEADLKFVIAKQRSCPM